ncbi:o-succinylbenzoate--CoA ligase [Thalassiella azotivora]
MPRPLRTHVARWEWRLPRLLAAALDGTGPALLPVPDGEPGDTLRAAARLDDPVDDDVVLLLPTSGSTGTPKVVELTAAALLASAEATAQRVGGHGQWLLALPLTHVAGWQVLVRGVLAGTEPLVLDPRAPFAAADLAAATTRMRDDVPRLTSLVPTQLSRVLADDAATQALASFAAVLVGGAATPATLLDRARARGVRVVTTYGMTETSGGCVYDGVPLDGVLVRTADDRVLLGGPVLARGYRDPAATREAFTTDGQGARWFRTSDRGALDGGRLRVLGRLDDVLVSGGANVHPAAVEAVVSGLDGVEAVVVVGVPDPTWGQAVVALVQGGRQPSPDAVRRAVTQALGREHAPRHVLAVERVPLLGIGKPDRRAAARVAAAHLGAPPLP